MKVKLFMLTILFLSVSCNNEISDIDDLLPKYQLLCNAWEPVLVAYDSMGVRVTKPIPYDKLMINDNLTYEIYSDTIQIEQGIVIINSQTADTLELYFDAEYPMWSSQIGSHIFGYNQFINLNSLSNDEMIFSQSEYFQFRNTEFHFRKF